MNAWEPEDSLLKKLLTSFITIAVIFVIMFCICRISSANTNDLTIMSFNIRSFGVTKASDPNKLDIIAKIISKSDICAVQESRDKSSTSLYKLRYQLAHYGNYDFIMSKRHGRSSYKEKYIYFFDRNKVRIREYYSCRDNSSTFSRPGFVVAITFNNKDIVLINVHIAPNEVEKELLALRYVIDEVRIHHPNEDIVILGDFNMDGDYYDEDRKIISSDGTFVHHITNDIDTTVADGSNTYDRILVSSELSKYVTESGVLQFDNVWELLVKPSEISDHYPVFIKLDL